MNETIRYAFGTSILGDFILATSDQGLVALEFARKSGSPFGRLIGNLHERFADANLVEDVPSLQDTVCDATALLLDPASDRKMAVDLRGSEFEVRVWKALQKIPPGQMTTYGDLATELGEPGRARDVGAACAANTIAVVVPCHRVVRKDGTLAGYRWGIQRKSMLLEREQRALGFSLPHTAVDFKF